MSANVIYNGRGADNELSFTLSIEDQTAETTRNYPNYKWRGTVLTDLGVAEVDAAWQGRCIVENNSATQHLAHFTKAITFNTPGCVVNGKGVGAYKAYNRLSRYDMKNDNGDLAGLSTPDSNGMFSVTWKKEY